MTAAETVDIWVSVDDEAETRGISSGGLGGLDSDEGMLVKHAVPKNELLKTISEISALFSDIVDHVQHPRVRLDEVTISFELSNQGFLKWAIGVGVKGGTSLKFKIDPPAAAIIQTKADGPS